MLSAPVKRFLTTPGHRFAALMALGMLVVATPIADAWRRLGLEVQAAVQARHGLAPLALAVKSQRGLMSHQPYSAAVLAGRGEMETERRLRQLDVDISLSELLISLEAWRLDRALHEADQLRQDWSDLLRGIGERQMRPAASDTAHQLLVEQTFVIADLSIVVSGLQGQAGRAFEAGELRLATQLLPRLAATLAAGPGQATQGTLAVQGDSQRRRQVQRVTQDVAQDVAQLVHQLLADSGSAGRGFDPSVLQALLALRSAMEPLAAASPDATDAQHAARASLDAAAALVEHIDGGLMQAVQVLRSERQWVVFALSVALLLGTFAASLALPRKQASDDDPPPSIEGTDAAAVDLPLHGDTARAESEQPAGDLLQRLRAKGAPAHDPEPQAHPYRP